MGLDSQTFITHTSMACYTLTLEPSSGLSCSGSHIGTVGLMVKLKVGARDEAEHIWLGLLEGTDPSAVALFIEAAQELTLVGLDVSPL